MVRLSLRIIVLCFFISLGVGFGIGYVTSANRIQSLDSEIAVKEERISLLSAEVEQRKTKSDALALDLERKQESYNALLEKQSDISRQLHDVQTSHAELVSECQIMQQQYEALREACSSATVEELIALRDQISSLESENGRLKIDVAQLEKQIIPSPDHALVRNQVWGNPEFRSAAWEGRDYELQGKLEELAQLYYRTHTYIVGETDCNDMAVDIWNMLLTESIKSVIVIGNWEKVGEKLEECNHAWLYVFNAEGKIIYLEPTLGKVIYGRLPDGTTNPEVIKYRDGFMYERPSDLWKDLKKMW